MVSLVIIVLCSANIVIDYKRLKAVKENTKTYKAMCNKLTETQVKVDFYMKKDKTITIDEVVEEVAKKLKQASS